MHSNNTLSEEQDEVDVTQLFEDLKKLNLKYNADMNTLNRILSTYEDEISSLKQQYFDLSFKYKQLVQAQGE